MDFARSSVHDGEENVAHVRPSIFVFGRHSQLQAALAPEENEHLVRRNMELKSCRSGVMGDDKHNCRARVLGVLDSHIGCVGRTSVVQQITNNLQDSLCCGSHGQRDALSVSKWNPLARPTRSENAGTFLE